jgi:hypothetical protein
LAKVSRRSIIARRNYDRCTQSSNLRKFRVGPLNVFWSRYLVLRASWIWRASWLDALMRLAPCKRDTHDIDVAWAHAILTFKQLHCKLVHPSIFCPIYQVRSTSCGGSVLHVKVCLQLAIVGLERSNGLGAGGFTTSDARQRKEARIALATEKILWGIAAGVASNVELCDKQRGFCRIHCIFNVVQG